MNLPPNPFPSSEFDSWADTYDASVASDQFPFHGYSDLITTILNLAKPSPGQAVLDLGTGTGNLAALFDQAGCNLFCTDFSEAMLIQARHKLPNAQFFKYDLRADLPPTLTGPFDHIVSAYVFHHFELEEKVRILRSLLPLLAPGGRIIIGDIIFPDRAALEQVKARTGKNWDDEFYWVADESYLSLEKAGVGWEYTPISEYTGIYCFPNE
jgi:putative AdoMet-dependent methyltransferase